MNEPRGFKVVWKRSDLRIIAFPKDGRDFYWVQQKRRGRWRGSGGGVGGPHGSWGSARRMVQSLEGEAP